MKEIGAHAFAHCGFLKQLTLPDGVSEIADGLCYRCRSLEQVNLKGNVLTIGRSAFEDCIRLTEVRGIRKDAALGAFAFRNCKGMKAAEGTGLSDDDRKWIYA